MRRRIHVCHMRRRIHVCQVRSDVLTAEVTLILRRNIALTVASKHSESGQQGTLPDREIVSISIFNSGAANHNMPYPNDQFGTKISSRWASIVFAKAQDARDVIELYGGGGEQAVRFPSLFEKNILHLWPLYRIVADAAVPFPPFLRLHFLLLFLFLCNSLLGGRLCALRGTCFDPRLVRARTHTQGHPIPYEGQEGSGHWTSPREPPSMISETHVGGTELRYRWEYCSDADYQEKDPGKVRILMLRETRQVCLRVEFVWSSCGVSVRTQAFSGVLKLAHTPANTHTTSWGRSTELRILGSLILQTKTGALSTDHGDGSKRASIRIQHGGYFRRCHRRQQS